MVAESYQRAGGQVFPELSSDHSCAAVSPCDLHSPDFWLHARGHEGCGVKSACIPRQHAIHSCCMRSAPLQYYFFSRQS